MARTNRYDDREVARQTAIAWLYAAQYARVQYDQELTRAIAEYGELAPSEPAVSGIYNRRFPEQVKDRLRFYACQVGACDTRAWETWRLAGRQGHTFRRLAEGFRRLPDGRVSYY